MIDLSQKLLKLGINVTLNFIEFYDYLSMILIRVKIQTDTANLTKLPRFCRRRS